MSFKTHCIRGERIVENHKERTGHKPIAHYILQPRVDIKSPSFVFVGLPVIFVIQKKGDPGYQDYDTQQEVYIDEGVAKNFYFPDDGN